jgi:hypothetical protein
MKKVVLAALFLSVIVSAVAFQASMDTEKSTAEPTSPAEFDLNIENSEAVNHSYSLSVLSPKSSWIYYPNNVKVPAGENRSFPVTVTPVNNSLQQRYSFDLTIRESRTGKTEKLTGFFTVEQPYNIQFTALEKNGEQFSPGEVIETSLTIKNLDNQRLGDYSVSAAYENQSRSETGTPILPGGERKFEFSFRVEDDASPGERQINYTVDAGEETRTASQLVEIREVQNISRNSTTENRILTLTEKKFVRNTGNSPAKATITAEIPSYLSSITSTNPEAENRNIEDETVFTWEETLGPGESFSASYTVKYWIPVLGLALLLGGMLAIKKLGTSISIRKSTEEKDGEIKVMIELENKGERTVSGRMEEFIPDIATVDERFNMNAPKIQETTEGTKLSWELELEPGDQRIIQYKIRPKVEVEEEVELQKTFIKDSNGQKIAESNRSSARFRPGTT